MKNCDCLIGRMSGIGKMSGSDTYKSTLEYEVQNTLRVHNNFAEMKILSFETITARDVIDGRRGYLRRFKHCPFCGEKLNWKQILKDFK